MAEIAHRAAPWLTRLVQLSLIVLVWIVLGARTIYSPLAARPTPAGPAPIHLLTIDGIINPLSSQYLARGLGRAVEQQAAALILQLNTPGGLESSMRRMVQAMLNAPLPVVVYVAPAGARAASAGMFITIAANIAVMAPGTNIGAAHPVALGASKTNSEEGGQEDPSMTKAAQDAAAFARTLAAMRQRNAEWAEAAVLESVSLSAEEALQRNVIDFIAEDLDELLRQISGQSFMIAGRQLTLNTHEAELVHFPMNLAERILSAITDPNIAYLLITFGSIGIIAELYSPGLIIPGVTGLIALLLAFAGLGSLPLNWVGMVLLIGGIVLMLLDLYSEGFGPLVVLGSLAFLLGSLFLYRPFTPVSPAMPTVHVNYALILTMSAGMTIFFLVVVRAVVRSRANPLATGEQLLIGQDAVTISCLNPRGIVRLGGEEWSAVLSKEEFYDKLEPGQLVQVKGVEGVTLIVGVVRVAVNPAEPR